MMTEAEARARAKIYRQSHLLNVSVAASIPKDGFLKSTLDAADEAYAAAIRQAQKEAVEACREVVSGDNRPERVCCIGTRGSILRKLDALIKD